MYTKNSAFSRTNLISHESSEKKSLPDIALLYFLAGFDWVFLGNLINKQLLLRKFCVFMPIKPFIVSTQLSSDSVANSKADNTIA